MELLTIFAHSKYKASNLQLFRDMDEHDLMSVNRLISSCCVMLVPTNKPIIQAHSTDSRLYIVLSGALKAQSPENTPDAAANNVHYLPGECVGELSVLDDEDQPRTIVAIYDSEVLVIEATTLWQLIDEPNGVARNLLQLLSFRVRATNALLRRRHKVGEFYRQMSMTDGLTGIHNRAWLHSQLPQIIERSSTADNPLSIIMADLDHFKRFNDTHGHLIGDDAIQCAARILNSTLRPTDFAVRFGGEELLVILPDTTKEACFSVAKRLCSRLARSNILTGTQMPLPHITASFGVAHLTAGQDISALISAADAALYRAKNAGRNQVSY